MNRFLLSPSRSSIRCSSSEVPRVVVARACVWPRVKRAEPCVRGRTPVSQVMGRTWVTARPSARRPSSRISRRISCFSNSSKISVTCSFTASGSAATVASASSNSVRRRAFCSSFWGTKASSRMRARHRPSTRAFNAASTGVATKGGFTTPICRARSCWSLTMACRVWWPKRSPSRSASSGASLAPALHHDHGGAGAGQDHVHVALGQLGVGGIHHQAAADAPDPDAADGPLERDLGHREGRRGPHHRQHVGVVLLIGGEDGGDDLDVLVVAVRKQRTDRPVDQPGGQRLLLVRAPLALEEAAGDLPGGVGPFLIVHRQGEEVDPLAGLLGGHGRHQDHRVPVAHPGCAVRGAGHAPRLDGEGPPPQVDLAPIRHLRIPNLSITCL